MDGTDRHCFWLEPRPEDKAVGQISEAGHVIVPCDWAPNMAALSCGAPASLEARGQWRNSRHPRQCRCRTIKASRQR